MAEFIVPPQNTLGIKMPDSTVYYPNRSGTIHVENKKHAEQIRKSGAKNNLDMIKQKSIALPATDEWRCPRCLFRPQLFSSRCPRCDEPFPPKEQRQ